MEAPRMHLCEVGWLLAQSLPARPLSGRHWVGSHPPVFLAGAAAPQASEGLPGGGWWNGGGGRGTLTVHPEVLTAPFPEKEKNTMKTFHPRHGLPSGRLM